MIPLAIILFVDAGDHATPLPNAVVHAVEQSLGTAAAISTRELEAGVSDADLAARGHAAGAALVARISWDENTRRAARLLVVDLRSGRTHERQVIFQPEDSPLERGRTLGLLLAAAIDPEAGEPGERAPPPAAPVAPPAPAASVDTQLSPTVAPAPWGVDAAVEAGYAVGGSGSGVGGSTGIRRNVGRWFAVRLGGRGRFGNVGAAQASASTFALAAGVVVVLLPTDRRRLGLSLRGDALVLIESLTHLSSDDPAPVRQGRVLPGAAAAVEVHWSLAPSLSLLLAAGPEIAFGRTGVFVGPDRVAELTPVRFFGQFGLLARF